MNLEKNIIEKFKDFQQFPDRRLLKSIGDDAAVLKISEKKALVISADSLIENTHFLRDQITPEMLAKKALQVNLSDMAAMSAAPKYLILNLALTKDLIGNWLNKFTKSLKQVLKIYQINLIGGDTNCSEKQLLIDMTIIGEADISQIKYRNQAKRGDLICVSGHLGDANAGFYCLQKNIKNLNLIRAHLKPHAQVELGLKLGKLKAVHAMLDVSDGLLQDLENLSQASNCGYEIHLEKLPISNALKNFCKKEGLSPIDFALAGGEDYQLLFTVDAKVVSRLPANVSVIGTIQSAAEKKILLHQKPYHLHLPVFQHFNPV